MDTGGKSFNKQKLLDILFDSDHRLTSSAYIRNIRQHLNISRKSAKKIVRQLVEEQELCYHDLYGNTYVEKSFLRPVAVCDLFTVSPPGFSALTLPEQNHVIYMHQGISFGSGQHPTTRLCLMAIEHALHQTGSTSFKKGLQTADIGTGSGVLAIAMCLACAETCNAYEIDPVSIREAEKNIQLNHMEETIHLSCELFTEQPETFHLICANLRYPTLRSMARTLHKSLLANGTLILSGVRVWEKEVLLDHYTKAGFSPVWQKDTNQWSGFVLTKNLC